MKTEDILRVNAQSLKKTMLNDSPDDKRIRAAENRRKIELAKAERRKHG
jgi:hypothetical protein